MKLPTSQEPGDTYREFDLYFHYIPEGRLSERSIVYVYVADRDTADVVFVQASMVRGDVAGDLNEEETRRRLMMDARRRVRHRIDEETFAVNQVYTVELDERTLKSLG